jgi:hypothetical protein
MAGADDTEELVGGLAAKLGVEAAVIEHQEIRAFHTPKRSAVGGWVLGAVIVFREEFPDRGYELDRHLHRRVRRGLE